MAGHTPILHITQMISSVFIVGECISPAEHKPCISRNRFSRDPVLCVTVKE